MYGGPNKTSAMLAIWFKQSGEKKKFKFKPVDGMTNNDLSVTEVIASMLRCAHVLIHYRTHHIIS